MTFWSGDTLEHNLNTEKIVLPFRKEQIDCAAYTLRMGSEIFITEDINRNLIEEVFNSFNNSEKVIKLGDKEHFTIPPGQFAYLLTKEHLNIPKDVLAFISLKSTYKFKGLINVSGFHVDPGFRGNLVYAVYNAGPQKIRLSENENLFLIWFTRLDNKSDEHYWKKEKQDRISEKIIVNGEIISLQGLNKKLNNLQIKFNTFIAIILAFAGLAAFIATSVRVMSYLKGL
tara:strand:- start:906 stop:1592 length:687 start_codon:yes stop_codon:yes gene_type:complete